MEGTELKRRRERLSMTQTELAKELGVKQNTVYRWEADKLPISRIVDLALQQIEARLRNPHAGAKR